MTSTDTLLRIIVDVTRAPGLGYPSATVANHLTPDIMSIPAGSKREYVLNGVEFTVYYDEQGAVGDNGQPVRGDVTGDYEVLLGIDGPLGLRHLAHTHVSPHGTSGHGNAYSKAYSAEQTALAMTNHVRRVTSHT